MGTFQPATIATQVDQATIANRVDQRREDLGVSVLDLAESTGIPRTTLQRRLDGKQPFTVPELDAVSRRLDKPITAWFEGVA